MIKNRHGDDEIFSLHQNKRSASIKPMLKNQSPIISNSCYYEELINQAKNSKLENMRFPIINRSIEDIRLKESQKINKSYVLPHIDKFSDNLFNKSNDKDFDVLKNLLRIPISAKAQK
jgi:hypothetical protein